MKTRVRRAAMLVALALALWFSAGAWTAYVATRPSPRHVPPRERIGDRNVTTLEVRAVDGVRTVAWFVDAGEDRCAVLLAGIHGYRRACLPRTDYWLSRGWSVLIPDLRGTGESDPRPTSFGWNERLDVEAWIRKLRERGVRSIALHGQSLGAAAAVYAADDRVQVELLVLDACYDDIDHALARRLPFVPLPRLAFFPVQLFARLRLGVAPEQLRPANCLTRIRTPTFLAAGSDDPKVGKDAPSRLLDASAAVHKQLHWVAGAQHEELWIRDPAGLGRALDAFIAEAGIE